MFELELMELQSADVTVRFEAARRLGDLPHARTTAALVETLNDSNAKVQYAAMSSLIKHNNRTALAPLLDLLLATPNSALWKLIVLSAGLRLRAGLLDMVASGDADVADRVLPAFDSPAFNAQQQALFTRMIGRTGDARQSNRLLAMLDCDDDVLRTAAAEALGWMGEARAVEPLIAILEAETNHEAVREAAAEALGKLGDHAAVEPLILTLGDPNEWLRRAAAVALGELGSPRAVEPLSNLLCDESGIVEDAAFEALKRLSERHFTSRN